MLNHSNVLLGTLNISVWTGRRYDDKATQWILDSNESEGQKIGRFNKALLPQKPKSFADIKRTSAEMREAYYASTLVYQNLKVRLIPTKSYLELAEKINRLSYKFKGLVDTFLDEYPLLIAEAQSHLGPLFKKEDYPSVGEMRTKFNVHFSSLLFPNYEDMNLDLPTDVQMQMRDNAVRENAQQSRFAKNELINRIKIGLVTLQDNCLGKRVYRSAFEHLIQLVENVTKLNIWEDAIIDEIAEEICEKLMYLSADDVRTDKHIKSNLANFAKDKIEALNHIAGAHGEFFSQKSHHAELNEIALQFF